MRRAATLDKYEAEIEALYRTLEIDPGNSSVLNSKTTRTPDFEEILELVKVTVHTILDKSLHDEDDIFQAGVDR